MPILFRPHRAHARFVVPVPMKGSYMYRLRTRTFELTVQQTQLGMARVTRIGSSAKIGPYLAKPQLVVLFTYHAENSFSFARAAITTGLALHQYEFNVIFYDCVWFVRFPEKPAPTGDFVGRVSYLVPNNCCEVVEADCLAVLLNARVQRHNCMSAVIFPPR